MHACTQHECDKVLALPSQNVEFAGICCLCLFSAGDWFCTHEPYSYATKSSSDSNHSSLASWNDSSDSCRVVVWSSCAWTSCMHCYFLSLKKNIFGKCPTFEQILHLCLLAQHLKLSLCLKSPHHVQSPLDLKFCLPLLSFYGG